MAPVSHRSRARRLIRVCKLSVPLSGWTLNRSFESIFHHLDRLKCFLQIKNPIDSNRDCLKRNRTFVSLNPPLLFNPFPVFFLEKSSECKLKNTNQGDDELNTVIVTLMSGENRGITRKLIERGLTWFRANLWFMRRDHYTLTIYIFQMMIGRAQSGYWTSVVAALSSLEWRIRGSFAVQRWNIVIVGEWDEYLPSSLMVIELLRQLWSYFLGEV